VVLHRRGKLAIAAAVLAVFFASCTRTTAPDTTTATAAGVRHPWTVPDTLRIGVAFVPRTLNPLLGTQTVESTLARLVTDILVTVDAQGNLVPDLAKEVPTTENGDISADGLTVKYPLRENVKWHDGKPFTSKDVKFTYDAIMNPNNDIISRHGYDVIASVDTPDDHTIIFHLKHRFAPFVATVFGESDSPYGILPEHILGKLKSINDIPYNSAPIGTGPFKFVHWLRANEIEYTRNDEYFLGKPKLQKIVIKLIPDENTEITEIRTHELDWMFEASVNAYKQLRAMPLDSIHLTLTPYNGYVGIMFNNAKGPTKDIRVRKAILYALDKNALVRTLTFGAADAATQDLPPFMWAYSKTLVATPYNVQAAKALLAEAGYGPNHPLPIELYYEQSSVLFKTGTIQIQAILREIGIDVHLHQQLSSVIYGGYGAGGTLARGKYDMALYIWIAGIDPDDSSQFSCSERPPAGFNQSFYCSKAMDAAQKDALENYEPAVRKAAYARVQAQLAKDVPMDFLFWPKQIQAINPDLKGFDPNPVVETWDAYRWSI
jgi:peptide/nickel transport system substrate-binding protein